jgi:hypothetical protein
MSVYEPSPIKRQRRSKADHESLERAQHAAHLAQYISKQVPEPPFRKPGSVQRASEWQRKSPFKRPGEAIPVLVRDQRHW